LLIIPGASNEIELSWARPLDRMPDSVERRRRDLVDQLALSVLNRRLEKLSRSDKPPFLTAGVGYDPVFKSARIASARAVTAPDKWREGIEALDQEVRRFAKFGVLASELQREIVDTRTSLVNDVAGADTRRTPELASDMVNAVDEEQVFDTPAAELALFDAVTKDLTAESVSKAGSTIFAGAGPLLQVNAPAPVEGGEAAVEAVFKVSSAVEVKPPAADTTVAWPYARFGTQPGLVAKTNPITDLGAIQYQFANGIGLTVKQTTFKTDQVLVTVKFGSGRSTLPSDRTYPVWAGQAFTLGGLRLIRQEDMERALNGRTYDAGFNIGDDGFSLRGETKPADIDVQMQVLAAYATDAGWRPEAFERLRVAMSNALPQFEATASGILSRDSQFLLTGGDKRYQLPDSKSLSTVKPEDFRSFLETPLKTGPVEITIVGDISPDKAVKAVADTFGALPPRPELKREPANPVHFPTPGDAPITLLHKGRPDQAIAMVGWSTTDFYANTRLARTVSVLQDVLENRLVDQVRVAEGSTYSPQGDSRPSEVYPGYGYMIDFVETPVARIDGFFANVSKITGQLRDAPPTSDEMTRALKPRIERITKSQQTNDYWLARLGGSISDPRRLGLIRTTLAEYQSVTAADVQAAAKQFLTEKAQWKLVIRAESKPDDAKR
jgi:zinc protease